MEAKIIKIMEVKSRDRVAFPKEARDVLRVSEGDYVAYVKDKGEPGVRVVKVRLDLEDEE